MVFGALYRQKARQEVEEAREKVEEAREEARREAQEARKQGHAEADAAWRGWNQRRLEAEANGLPFNEPPPSASSADADGA